MGFERATKGSRGRETEGHTWAARAPRLQPADLNTTTASLSRLLQGTGQASGGKVCKEAGGTGASGTRAWRQLQRGAACPAAHALIPWQPTDVEALGEERHSGGAVRDDPRVAPHAQLGRRRRRRGSGRGRRRRERHRRQAEAQGGGWDLVRGAHAGRPHCKEVLQQRRGGAEVAAPQAGCSRGAGSCAAQRFVVASHVSPALQALQGSHTAGLGRGM